MTGNTLLTPSQVEKELAPFQGADKSLADVEKARDALQKRYEADGFLTVAVAIPQQTVESGVVRLEVLEARLGEIEVQNAGIDWLGEQRVRARAAPHRARRGAATERSPGGHEGRESQPRRARAAAARGGHRSRASVDVALIVDDTIPLHGGINFTNDHTAGSPETRMDASLSYSNLWGIGHEASVFYQFVPTHDFSDVQIFAGTYRAPMPWDEEQQLFAYYAKSDTTNAAATGGGLSILGKGSNSGLRYILPLPLPKSDAVLALLARAHLRRRLQGHRERRRRDGRVDHHADQVPAVLARVERHARRRAGDHEREGRRQLQLRRRPCSGSSTEDFQINRGGIDPSSPVNGNYQIIVLGLQHTMRLPGLLADARGRPLRRSAAARQGLPRRLDLRAALERTGRRRSR